jgi:hypothetical protein
LLNGLRGENKVNYFIKNNLCPVLTQLWEKIRKRREGLKSEFTSMWVIAEVGRRPTGRHLTVKMKEESYSPQ